VANLLVNGGPVAHAERIATFCALHGLDPAEQRRLRYGFSAGRFEFMARAHGLRPRDALEVAAWPVLKGKVFAEACEIFLRLLARAELHSAQLASPMLERAQFRSEADWMRVVEAARAAGHRDLERIVLPRRWDFDVLKIIPCDWRPELLDLIVGSHEPAIQEQCNQTLPVKVFNLSITPPAVIEDTHARMSRAYHPSGGPWHRDYMPRTVMVFLNEEAGLSPAQRRAAAREEAAAALSAYWTALEGTLDPRKVAEATDNAVVGDAEEVAEQLRTRFHPEDRLMLWFDFFNHDSARVIRNMAAFQREVAPRLPPGPELKAAH
jgi:hypothetical protein